MTRTCESENENLGRPVPAQVTPSRQAALTTKQPGGVAIPPANTPDISRVLRRESEREDMTANIVEVLTRIGPLTAELRRRRLDEALTLEAGAKGISVAECKRLHALREAEAKGALVFKEKP